MEIERIKSSWLKIGLAFFLGASMLLHEVFASEDVDFHRDRSEIVNASTDGAPPGIPSNPGAVSEEETVFAEMPIPLNSPRTRVSVANIPSFRAQIAGKDHSQPLERPPQPACC